MDLTLSADQEAVRDAIRQMLAERVPLTHVRTLAGQVDAAAWQEAGALGWFGLGLPEAAGGAGYGLPEEMLLFIELGRGLAPGPWLGTVLAAHALAGAAGLDDVHAAVLAGTRRVAVVDDADNALGGGGRLMGSVPGIADAGSAQGLLVLGQHAVRYVAADTRGLTITPGAGIDSTRYLAEVAFASVPVEVVSNDAGRLRDMATVLVAAEAVGIAERTLELSVAYAKVRQQFGKPIGSFQAIKHRCADMAVRAEVARSAVTYAAVAVRDREPDAACHVHGAKVLAVDAALKNATDNVQNHGGMGYTWEGDAHLYLKRAWLAEHAFGPRTAHLDALAAPWRG